MVVFLVCLVEVVHLYKYCFGVCFFSTWNMSKVINFKEEIDFVSTPLFCPCAQRRFRFPLPKKNKMTCYTPEVLPVFFHPKNQRKKGDVNHRTLGKPKHELQGSESHGFQHCYFVKGTFGRGLMVIDFLGGGNSNIFVPFTPIWGRLTHFDDHIFQRGWNHQLVFCSPCCCRLGCYPLPAWRVLDVCKAVWFDKKIPIGVAETAVSSWWDDLAFQKPEK